MLNNLEDVVYVMQTAPVQVILEHLRSFFDVEISCSKKSIEICTVKARITGSKWISKLSQLL